ncbi:MAG: hypothetical protein MMC33_008638 [Icmadophila ericetorum]|nr:hypothetical protein [Icmadophila ericetorum]
MDRCLGRPTEHAQEELKPTSRCDSLHQQQPLRAHLEPGPLVSGYLANALLCSKAQQTKRPPALQSLMRSIPGFSLISTERTSRGHPTIGKLIFGQSRGEEAIPWDPENGAPILFDMPVGILMTCAIRGLPN